MEVVFAFLDARRRGDLDDAASLLDPGVAHLGFTDGLACHGREEVLELMRRAARGGTRGVDRLELSRSGPGVVVAMSGPRFAEAPWAGEADTIFIAHRVRDGRITEMRDFLDRDAAMVAAATEPAP